MFEAKPHQLQLFLPEVPTSSAIRAYAPDTRTTEIASDQRGLSAGEAAMWGGLEDPKPRQTPGVPPSQLRRGLDAHDELIGRHHARKPSRQNTQKQGLSEVADKRRQEQLAREAAAIVEGDEGKVTLSEAMPRLGQPETPPLTEPSPPSDYERSRSERPPLPRNLFDEILLRS